MPTRLLPLPAMMYSRSRVDRAGKLFADQLRLAAEGKRNVGHQREQIEESVLVIDWWRERHAKPLSIVAGNLHHYVATEGQPTVAQRLKRFPTIVGKLYREPGMKLSRMEDIGGVRAILPDQDAAHSVASQLKRNWTITRVRDYVSRPKPDGYRALHLINRNHGRLIEIQLRTPRQDLWANMVESFTRMSPGLKFGQGAQELREYFAVLGEYFSLSDRGEKSEIDQPLIDRLAELQAQADKFVREKLNEP